MEGDLLKAAEEAWSRAYAPYSGFRVGAALLSRDGRIFTGANVENASYGLSLCAERAAVARAVTEGAREFEMVLLYTDGRRPVAPCGACRQFLFEFNPEMLVVSVCSGGARRQWRVRELLPDPFFRGRRRKG